MLKTANNQYPLETYLDDNTNINTLKPEDIQKYEDISKIILVTRGSDLKTFLYSLIDYAVIYNLFTTDNYDEFKEDLPYYLTYLFLSGNKPQPQTIQQNLYDYNYNQVTLPFFEQMFNDPYFPDSYYKQKILTNFAKQTAIQESNMQKEYLDLCEKYITQLPQHITINEKQYIQNIKKNPQIARQLAIQQSLKTGKLPIIHGKKPRMDMNTLINDTTRYIEQLAEYESVKYANESNKALGKQPPYATKTWVWSGKKETRHRGMEGQTVPVNEPFIVTNERNGDTVHLMFPRDYARDYSGSNTVNCACSVIYGKNKEYE